LTAPFTTNGKRGYILLIAIVLATIMSLFLAMAIQPVGTTSLRIREKELIYRGEHLAEGIRRYYVDHGRFPLDLDELIEGDQHYVRKIYTDPMSADGEWTLVYLTPEDRGAVTRLNAATVRMLNLENREVNSENLDENRPGLSTVDSVFRINTRQITGLRSKSSAEGLTMLQDSRIYSDWLFSALPREQTGIGDILDQITKP